MIRPGRKYERDGNQYEEYQASSKAEAVDHLRQTAVKDEGVYISVITPEGRYGRDLLEIYDEDTGKRIELPKRLPFPTPVKSMKRCAGCGYTVLPISRVPGFSEPHEIVRIEEEVDFQESGLGYVCAACRTLWCAYCTGTHGAMANCSMCNRRMEPLME